MKPKAHILDLSEASDTLHSIIMLSDFQNYGGHT